MRYSRAIPLLFPLLALAPALHAQGPTATLDTAVITIGEPATLTLTAPALSPGTAWPQVPARIGERIEVLRALPVDSAPEDGLLRLHLLITSFDSGYHAIAPFTFGDGSETAPLLLKVGMPPPDTIAMYPARGIQPLPFHLGWWIARHGWKVLAGAAAVVIAYLLLLAWRRRRRGPVAPPVVAATRLPLHEEVMNALRALEAERLWQQGREKEYHSRLSGLLRTYVEDRYGVQALERTTGELLAALRPSAMPAAQLPALENLLRLADMVKFAKYRPSPAEHEQAMAAALRFVADNGSPAPIPSDGTPA